MAIALSLTHGNGIENITLRCEDINFIFEW